MKKTMIIIVVMLVFSCADKNRKESPAILEEPDFMEVDKNSEKFTLEKLAYEKLHGYFEMLKLTNEHPEFKKDILLQLKELSKEELVKMDGLGNFSIRNIRSGGTMIKLSDSVQQLKLYYDIILEDRQETDSINALIMSKIIILDGVAAKSTKISFASIR